MRKQNKKESNEMKENPLAIFTADWHLSPTPPVWRSAEPDWYAAMLRPLREIRELRNFAKNRWTCPIIIAGDIYDKWNSPPELINWILYNWKFGDVYAIPGQHDLPNHQPEQIHRSAFFTLVQTYCVYLANPVLQTCEYKLQTPGIVLHPFPYGHPFTPLKKENADEDCLDVAVVHAYRWIEGHSYSKANLKDNLRKSKRVMIDNKYMGYDIVVFGDNHKGFTTKIGKTTIFNCGTLMRRKSDEVDYKPQVGLLMPDDSIKVHYLDISEDKCLPIQTAQKQEAAEIDMQKFARELKKLGTSALDFSSVVKQYLQTTQVCSSVEKIIIEAMADEGIYNE